MQSKWILLASPAHSSHKISPTFLFCINTYCANYMEKITLRLPITNLLGHLVTVSSGSRIHSGRLHPHFSRYLPIRIRIPHHDIRPTHDSPSGQGINLLITRPPVLDDPHYQKCHIARQKTNSIFNGSHIFLLSFFRCNTSLHKQSIFYRKITK
ncbi:hypothetical protein BGZ60DRAFT_114684 [Tricladium varicosporioides]|nr:hypothetical protein BGZ60DRAFT_114684 [Hymenoscyphus varicosporioides]